MEIFTCRTNSSSTLNSLKANSCRGFSLLCAFKYLSLMTLALLFNAGAFAQCNNAVTSGDFTSTPVGIYPSVGSFLPGTSGDLLHIVDNNGSKGAHIKRTSKYSLKQVLTNLKADTTYSFSFNFSLLDDCHANAQTSFRVEVISGTTVLKQFDINATNGGGLQTIALAFTTPPGVTSASIVFTDPYSNKPSCGAVIDNLFILSPFSVSTTQSDALCFNQSSGSFTVTGKGGAGTYRATYSVNGNPAINIPMTNQVGTVNNLAAGIYTVTLIDQNGCTAVTTVTIGQPAAPVSVNAVKTDVTCSGAADGTITVNPAGGTAPYTYLWSNGETTQSVSGLAVGTYTVTVTDANGCQGMQSLNIMQPPSLMISTAKADLTCFGGNNGSISASVSGGTAPYSYSWSNGQTTQNISNLIAGDYTLTVTDARGCVKLQTVTIAAPPEILVTATSVNVTCFGSSTGSINLSVSGGSAPYSYSWSTGASSQNISNLAAGTYTVTVRDSKNCSTTRSITISQPSAIVIADTKTNVSCFGNADGAISLNPSGGTGPYTYLWNTGETTSSLSGLSAGTYSVTVTDAAGCNAVKTINVTQPAALTLSSSQTNILCFGSNTGAVNLKVTGGTAPFKYNWNSGGYVTEDLSQVPAGTYSVVVTDAKGCSSSRTVTITQLPAIVLSAGITGVKCFGGNTGAINLSVTGGKAPYTYLWSNGSATQDISSLTAGTYSVVVTDANGCTATLPFTVSQPAAPLAISATTVTNVTCFGGNNGSIDVSVSGGTAPYTYDWSDGQYSQDIFSLKAGDYTLVVTDAAGCTQNLAVSITQPAEIKAAISKIDPVCFGANNGSISLLNVTGGVSPYSFAWTKNGVALTNPDLSALTAGVYEVTITDQTGCSAVHRIALNDPVPITITVKQIDLICEGSDPSKSISLDITGGRAPYQKVYSPIDATTSLLTVTDALGCVQTKVVPYAIEPPIMVEASHTDILCYGDNTGKITVTVTGGAGPYNYIWTDAPTLNAAERTGLVAGEYEVRINDANGCELNSLVVEIKQPAAPITVSNVALKNVTCNAGNDGSISLDVSGGTANYSYLWSNGATTKDIANLTAGTYTLTITDAVMCQKVIPFVVTAPEPIVIAMTPVNISCNGAADGEISVSVTGGTGTYSYAWDGLPSGPFTATRTGLSPGTYGVMVTDAAGCTAFRSITLTQPNKLALSAETKDVDCFGGQSGEVEVEISGGTAPYYYNGNEISGTLVLKDLPAGSASVTITDKNGCEQSIAYTILEPQPIAFTSNPVIVSCKDGNDGRISLTGGGGTAPYEYLWSNGATTQNISGLVAGTYSVIITDDHNCTFAIDNIVVSEPVASLSFSSAKTDVLCFGDNSGSIDLTVSGGTAPYKYIWSNGAQTQDISNLAAGVYDVLIVDAKNCQVSASVTIEQPVAPISVSATTQDIVCYSEATGAISVAASGGTAPYQVLWASGETSWSRSGLAAGIYSGSVTDASGCSTDFAILVSQPTEMVLSISKADNVCPDGATGSAMLNVSGGTAPYTYEWSNGATSEEITGLAAGTYTVKVKDANGCISAEASVTITAPAPIAVNVVEKIDIKCYGDNSGAIDISVTGGTAPYFYEWSNGAISEDLTGLTAGIYSVKVTDINGCIILSSDITLTQPDQPLIAAVVKQDVSCYLGADGSISLTASGGTIGTGYTYLWNDGSTLASRSNLKAGVYSVVVTDGAGCQYSLSIQIYEPSPVTILANKIDVDCYGDASGSIQLNVYGGTPNYTFSWKKDGVSISSPNLNALTAGSYELTVTDSKGCAPVTKTIVIAQPSSALSVSLDHILNVSCFGGSDGSAIATATGGTAPYTYVWTRNGIAVPGLVSNMLSAGTYAVTVYDANGCQQVSASVTIAEPPVLSVSANSTPITCFGGTTTITTSATGGSPAYTFSLDGVNFQASGTFAGIPAGTHQVSVKDLNGCIATYQITVQQPERLDFTVTIPEILCSSTSSSATSVVVNITGGVGPYITDPIKHLGGSDYQVTIHDQNGCTIVKDIVITQPNPILVSVASKNISCFGLLDGEIKVSVDGGVLPYSFSIDGVDFSNSTGVFTGLAAQAYTIIVRDGNDCRISVPVTLTSPPSDLSATVTAGTILCHDGTTTATVVASGGTVGTGYSYSWNTLPVQTTATATGLKAGTYSVTVTDANGCNITTTPVTIGQPDLFELTSATVTSPILCFGETATVTLATTGGTAPISYTFNGVTNNSGTFTNIAAGAGLSFSIQDANACNIITGSLDISQPLELTGSLTARKNVVCFGGNDGTFSVLGANGTAPYTYSIDNGATSQANGTFTSLIAGNYNILITDANGCTYNMPVAISEPAKLVIAHTVTPVLCYNDGAGSVHITMSGGTAPYSYSIDGTTFQANGNFTTLAAGSYTVTVKDANGCTTTQAVVITGPTAVLSSSITAQTAVNCFGDGVGSVTVTGADGVAPYTYSIDGTTFEANGSFTALAAGSYTVTVKDANGCTSTQAVLITGPTAALTSSITAQTVVTCFGDGLGSVTVAGADGVRPYTYSIDGTTFQPSGSFTALVAGNYTVTVKDANGCTTTQAVEITGPTAALTSSITAQTAVTCFGDGLGSVTVAGADGVGPYTYSIDGTTFKADGTFIALAAGSYTVTIKDVNDCTTTQAVTITGPTAALNASITSQTSVNCFGDGLGSATVAGADGVAPYSYSIDGTTFKADGSFTALTAGNYTVTVKDANGCTTTQAVVITGPTAALTASITAQTAVNCFGTATGSATVSASGGTAPYTYSWNTSPVQTTATATSLAAGTYTVVVTDASGCTSTVQVTIDEPAAALSGNISAVTTSCKLTTDGSISVVVTGGTAPYTYIWNDNTTLNASTLKGISSGTYKVVITDASGCSITMTGDVTAGNCSPVSADDNYTGPEDNPVLGTVGNNDLDPDGDPLTYTLTEQPQNGTLVFNPDGSFTFTPSPDWNGSTEFKYQACDPAGLCDTATVNITITPVNNAPVATDDVYTTARNTVLNVALPGVITNDSDIDNDPLTSIKVSDPANGTVILNANGSFTYIPNSNFNGTDSFTYKVSDGKLESNIAKVTITVTGTNTPPVAVDDSFKALPGTPLNEKVSLNDSDADNDPLSFSLISGPQHGELTFNTDGTFTYIPESGYVGADQFTYKACDPSGACDDAVVNLTIDPSAVVSLTPSLSTIPEGNKVTITAVLSAPVAEDVEVTLSFKGDAVNGSDYNLFENFVTIRIPAGQTTTSQHFIIAASIDDVTEANEHVLVEITGVSTASVSIGTGADVTIQDVLPPVKEVTDENETNPGIKPDPLISPNQDGQGNEQFKIINIELFPNNEVIIFNRWGNEVYRVKGYDNNGKSFSGVANTGLLTNMNKDLPEGVYYYIIYTTDADGKKKLNKGYLILKR